ncbi:hypothetical protein HZA38_00455 [Candidatus Peregrinibacteria bacterium]|nr:hypothetical protein [Candidatus Peregrinibacteria bacterium]
MTKKTDTIVSSEPLEKKAATPVFEFVEHDENEKSSDINYDELLNVRVKVRGEPEEAQDSNIVFYCWECKHIIAAQKKKTKKVKFVCSECKSGDVYFGTERGIKGYFHLAA